MASSTIFVAVYMDDILITRNNEEEIQNLKNFLDNTFKIKDLGTLNFFLGIEVLYTDKGIILTQRKYATDLIRESGCSGTSLCPLPSNNKLLLGKGEHIQFPETYRKLVGKLNFLVNTRPDLAFLVQHLSQFMSDPRVPHFEVGKHVLQYINHDPGQGLLLNNEDDYSLNAYCDSDWAACPYLRRSVSGFIILLSKSPIAWKSKKQITVSLSYVEAEYRSMQCVTAELAWLTRLICKNY